jgi:predicted DNA-binding protein (UPF0278 family)
MLDSKEDLDVLLLAKELQAGIVASDEGVMKYAKRWGIRYEHCRTWPVLVKEYLKKVGK